MNEAAVGIVMGSDSDWPLVKKACETLDKFGVAYETRVISAHRTPGPSGFSVHGVFQAGMLKWIAIPFSTGSPRHRDRTCISCVSCIVGRFFTH